MKEVFAAHPKVKKIWVVKNMPFLDEKQAINYALSQKAEVEEVERPVEEEETEFEKVKGSAAPEGVETPPAPPANDPPAPPANDPPAPPANDPPAPPANDPPAPPANDPPAIKAKGK